MNAIDLVAKFASLIKLSYIRKLPNGKWRVYSEKGKNLGTYPSEAQAKKRLRQIEFFKHKKASEENTCDNAIDLTHLDDLSYSAIVRELRKQSEDVAKQFLSIFKQVFDALVLLSEPDPEEKALTAAVLVLSKLHPIKLNHDH